MQSVIYKSLAGLAYIDITGTIFAAGIFWWLHTQVTSTDFTTAAALALVLLGLDLVGTFLAAYTYRLSKIVIDSEHVTVYQYTGLFQPRISEINLADLQVDSSRGVGILSNIFNYGTLIIESAAGGQYLKLTFVPDADELEEHLIALHDQAVKPQKLCTALCKLVLTDNIY